MIPYVLEQVNDGNKIIVHYGHFEKHKMIHFYHIKDVLLLNV
jgi:hypothetical protein